MGKSVKISNEPIAIIGMACRYPHSNNPQEFWKFLEEGRSGVGPIPKDRLEKGIMSKNYQYKKANYLNVPIDEFDAKFFEVSPKTATFMDPQLRLLMEVTWEALEDSLINPQSLRGQTAGIFVGTWLQDYQKLGLLSPDKDFFLVYMGRSMAARLAHFLGTVGPAIDTESACSSSMAAVHLACQSLQSKATDFAIVGGVNLLIEPPTGMDLDIGFATCKDGKCKSFSVDADGYGRAEGCSSIILKRLSDALLNGDKVIALIRGSAMTQEGMSKSMGTPTVKSEAMAISLALENAGVDPQKVSYIEAHGTGTKVGDPIEVAAITQVYSSSERCQESPIIIGTVKANLGHSEACSGLTSIMKVALCMQHSIIPRQLNFNKCNPDINFGTIPAILPTENVEWPAGNEAQPRIAGVSSFGISGTDCHVIMQEFQVQPENKNDRKKERSLHIMTISAKGLKPLDLLTEKYCDYLKQTGNKFEDVAFSANIGRAHFNYKRVILAANNTDALKNLTEGKYYNSNKESFNRVTHLNPKICFLFPGQGSQYPGMAKELYEQSPVFQQHFDECCKILAEEWSRNTDLKLVLWGNEDSNLLNTSINSQVAIFCVDYCLFKLWESWGIQPDYVLGHSLGESVAVVAAGHRDLRTGLKALLLKCQLVDKIGSGKMVAIRGSQEEVEMVIQEFLNTNSSPRWLDIAAVNSPLQTVVSGENECIEEFHNFCMVKKVKSTIIKSSHAFHSRALDPALGNIKEGLTTILGSSKAAKDLKTKYISSTYAKIIDKELSSPAYWIDNTRSKVKFMEACQVALNKGCKIFLEVGAQPILSAMVLATCNGGGSQNSSGVMSLPSIRNNENNWETILKSLAQFSVTSRGEDINWGEFDKPYLRRKVSLPNYPFIRKSYWINNDKVLSVISTQIKGDHPLLGMEMRIAPSTKVFQKEISWDENQTLNYLKDHCIRDFVVFPGAGFLEISLAAAFSNYLNRNEAEFNNNPLSLHNFKISHPLELREKESCQIQVVMRELKDSQFEIETYHFRKDSGKGTWVKHSLSSFNSANDTIPLDNEEINLKQVAEDLSQLATSEIFELYSNKLRKVGLNFGKSFQRMKAAWRDSSGRNESLVKIELSSELRENSSSYLLHPLIGDAMIQSTLILLPKDVLHVPVAIKKITLGRRDVGSCQELYVYCNKGENDEDEKGAFKFNVTLLNGEGNSLAFMQGLVMYATTAKNILMQMDSQIERENSLPKFWEEIWIPRRKEKVSGSFSKESRMRWLVIGAELQGFSELLANWEGRDDMNFVIYNKNGEVLTKEDLFKLLDHLVESIEGILYLNGLKKSEKQEGICKEFLYLCQWFQNNSHLTRVKDLKMVVVTQGLHLVVESDLVFNPSPATLGGMLKTLKNECPMLSHAKWIDLQNKIPLKEQFENILEEMLKEEDKQEDQISIRNGVSYVAKYCGMSSPQQNKATSLFKSRCSTYMITGGLRGLGFQVASWILENGGKYVVLVGRSNPSEEVGEWIKKWSKMGKKIFIKMVNVGSLTECEALFDWLKEMEVPPLRGVFHCAGVLADGAICNQSWEDFETVFKSKVEGSWNLHKFSLHYQLDYFVLFSSISSLFGIPGQVNYAAGNCYLDALARYRRSLDIPATVINWGNWEEVGMAADIQFPGMVPITVQQGLNALKLILGSENIRQVSVANFTSFSDFSKLCPNVKAYVDQKLQLESRESSSQVSTKLKIDERKSFWEDLQQIKKESEKKEFILKHIQNLIKSFLNLDQLEEIGQNAEFHTLGIDSLMIMELQNQLQEIFGHENRLTLTAAHLRDFPTIQLLGEMIYKQIAK